MKQKVIDRFWSHVEKTDNCWNWSGLKSKYGGPIFKMWDDSIEIEYSARRVSLQIHDKETFKNVQVFYTCENKLCVNPNHLITGNEGRFFSKIQKLSEANGGCWIWIGAEDKNGYGKFCYKYPEGGYQDVRATRYSWELHHLKIKTPILFVCHKCDNPRCVNPDHLFLGDAQDNATDRDQKNRNAKGEKSGSAIITEDIAKEVKQLYIQGKTVKEISILLNLTKNIVYPICVGRTWKHLF